MNRWIKGAALGLAVVGLMSISVSGGARAETLQSLRGASSIDEADKAPDIAKQKTGERFTRAYRQQPPMVPHKIDKYEIDLKVNQCIGCHDWPQNVKENAPKISETHYLSPTGVRLNKVSGSRWFCSQCHVPQALLDPLVTNTFESAIGQ
ncbi:MAG: nitrate reductase cytochrome c-type subunit [Alphaproteobacteria bacterium]|nr:nitrate reductase cytochrome c-type subunit [Alphaproteobacteria bacterium]